MEFPFRKLLRCRNSFEPMAWWEVHFGRLFSSVAPFLIPCSGKRATFYPSPDNPSIRLVIHESGRKYRAIPTGEHSSIYEDVGLDWKDVQAYQLCIPRLSDALRGAFNLSLATCQHLDHLDYIGHCTCNGVLKPVYACFSDNCSAALAAISPITNPKSVGCVMFSTHHTAASELLHSRGISSVILRDCLSLDVAGFSGECPKTCMNCHSSDLNNIELKKHLDSRFNDIEARVIPHAVRGTTTIRSASAGGKARSLSYVHKYAEAKKYIHEFHQRNPFVSFCEVRKKAAQHVSLSEAALRNHIKKGDFLDW